MDHLVNHQIVHTVDSLFRRGLLVGFKKPVQFIDPGATVYSVNIDWELTAQFNGYDYECTPESVEIWKRAIS